MKHIRWNQELSLVWVLWVELRRKWVELRRKPERAAEESTLVSRLIRKQTQAAFSEKSRKVPRHDQRPSHLITPVCFRSLGRSRNQANAQAQVLSPAR